MDRRIGTVMIAAAAFLAGGCGMLTGGGSFAGAPAAVRERAPLPACGHEQRLRLDDAYDVAARACFVHAVEESQPAELIVTEPTVEGDPVTRIARSLEDGTIEIFYDMTQDRYAGSVGWTRQVCGSILPNQGDSPPGVPALLLFGLGDCGDSITLR